MPAEIPKIHSQKFTARPWVERLVPVILGLLVVALGSIIVIIFLSLIGLTPGA